MMPLVRVTSNVSKIYVSYQYQREYQSVLNLSSLSQVLFLILGLFYSNFDLKVKRVPSSKKEKNESYEYIEETSKNESEDADDF